MNKYRRHFLKFLLLFSFALPFRIHPQVVNVNNVKFKYGVASGDPTNTHVILWTKLNLNIKTNVKVAWEISNERSFKNLISFGNIVTDYKSDYTVKVDAKIPPKFNGKKVYYRFKVGNSISDVGITSTLPKENPEKFNIAFCSCSNYPAGYFNAYREMALNKDIDLVLHLGDYLYEYAWDGYASERAIQMDRVVDPNHEILSLDDYRRRHATYRKDLDLKLLHASKPMIVVWDDHEITNDTWKEGAQNHSSDEGSFKKRKDFATQAYFEWMPIRENKNKKQIWRNFTVGNLINLLMLDTRHYNRDKQLDIEKYFEIDNFKEKNYMNDLKKPRNLLGKTQLKWVKSKTNNKYKWSIFGQQILIGPKYLPSVLKFVELETLPSYVHKYVMLAGKKIPYNTDQWDGYPKEREEFFEIIKNSQSNLILAGDSHNSWISNLRDNNDKFVGVEIGAPSISSPNFVDTFGEMTTEIDKSFVESNEDLVWTNGINKGYVELEVSLNFVDVHFHYVSTVKSQSYKKLQTKSFRINHAQPLT